VTACLLAESLPDARIVAVDVEPSLLDRVADRAARLRLTERVGTLHADLADPGVLLPDADLIWAAGVVHHVGDQGAALSRLAARLRPGGVLAVAEGGLPGRFLPRDTGAGRPGLQARLDALMEDWFTERRGGRPGSVRVIDDWPRLLAGTGLTPLYSRTFLVDLPAPVSAEVRHHVRDMLARQRALLGDRIEPDDRSQLDQLLEPGGPRGVLRRPDVFLLAASTVHAAQRTRGEET
jgi:SAM-dependent methyltransferase